MDEEAIKMTGLFITQGPVVQVKESGGDIEVLKDRDPSVAYSGPLIILVNKLSASASEIFAAALQDYGRAVIVGDSSTLGKVRFKPCWNWVDLSLCSEAQAMTPVH